jgi:hypothetical protein
MMIRPFTPALLALAGLMLAACSQPASTDAEPAESMETLAVEKRVAFMSGHVEAGLALYRAGAPEQAAPHLTHPVSETHADERAGIDALGFDQTPFLAVSDALEAGQPASEISPLLDEAAANMALVRSNAGGDPVEVIAYLMDVIDEEYAIGVTDGTITDPGEYQDAYGFAVVALDLAQQNALSEDVTAALSDLTTLWPEGGPLADSTPTPVDTVLTSTAQVRTALP